MIFKRSLVSVAIVATLMGCGGGGGDEPTSSGTGTGTDSGSTPPTTPAAQKQIGIFTDSAVANLAYKTASTEGFTNQNGEFQYLPGETVEFFIGDLSLGRTEAVAVVTPIELPAPLKISQLLQSFDSDGDPSTNGIEIPEYFHQVLETSVDGTPPAIEVNWDGDDLAFETALKDIITTAETEMPEEQKKGTIKFVEMADVKNHLEQNEFIVSAGGLSGKAFDRLEEWQEDALSAKEVFRLLNTSGEFEGLLKRDVDYTHALVISNDAFSLTETKNKIIQFNELYYFNAFPQLLNNAEKQTDFNAILTALNTNPLDFAHLTPEDVTPLFVTKGQLLNIPLTLEKIQAYATLQSLAADATQADRETVNEALSLIIPTISLPFDANYAPKVTFTDNKLDVDATISAVNNANRFISMALDRLDNPRAVAYGLQQAGFQNLDTQQEYPFRQFIHDGEFVFDELQAMIDGINELAAYARGYVLWPDQGRFDSPITSVNNHTSEELQALILAAGFTIPMTHINGQVVDHKPDLILRNLNNTLDLANTQRSLNAIKAPGVASLKVNYNPIIENKFRHYALRNDGSIALWGAKWFDNNWEDTRPEIKIINQGQSPAVQMFSNQWYGAAIREDGSVIFWHNRNFDQDVTVPQGLDGKNPAVHIVASQKIFAAIRSDGSVVTFGDPDSEELDISKYQAELDGSKHKVVSLHATEKAFAALLDNGKVVTWGNVSPADQDKLEVQVPGEDPFNPSGSQHLKVKAIYANAGAFAAIKGNNSVITWGDVAFGADSSDHALQLDGSVAVVSIARTESAFAALRSDGKVLAWGDVTNGGAAAYNEKDLPDFLFEDRANNVYASWLLEAPYGDPNAPDGINWDEVYTQLVYVGAAMPEDPSELESGVVSIHANQGSFTAIKSNGKHQAWGQDTYFPTAIQTELAAQPIKRIFADEHIFVAEMKDGSLVQWGREFGQLDYYGNPYGTSIPTAKLNGDIKVKDVKIESSTIAALLNNGSVVQWGVRGLDIISSYDITGKPTPDIQLPENWFNGTLESKKAVAIYKAEGGFSILNADGSVTTWGSNNDNHNSLFAARELGPNTSGVRYPQTHDKDGDGLMSDKERQLGTSPFSRDSDFDGVDDGTEVNQLASDPKSIKTLDVETGELRKDDQLQVVDGEAQPASWLKL
ncbi:hypothetical protein ACQEXU_08115 [Vibrio sp. TRT 21S02]|uniref:hypothetical protein n=1 Tax=Vibrio sp. TRT 21S02 TaxID=3418507 RepID=UPI003CF78F39